MDNKFLKIIGGIFVVLAIFAAIPFVTNMLNNKKTQAPKNLSVDLSGFNKTNVQKIAIKKGSDEKVLTSKDDGWYIGDVKADDDKVAQLFADFADLKIMQTASQNQDNQAKFEVSNDTATVLTITQNGQDSVFYVGKVASGAKDFYLRKDGIKNVYLVNGELRDKLVWTQDKWKKDQPTQPQQKPDTQTK